MIERLRAIARALNPPKPPPTDALLAMGMASAAAVAGAVVVRVNDASLRSSRRRARSTKQLAAGDPNTGIGGPLSAIEPASLEDDAFACAPLCRELRAARRQPPRSRSRTCRTYRESTLRDHTLLERLNALPYNHAYGAAKTTKQPADQPPRRPRNQCMIAHACASWRMLHQRFAGRHPDQLVIRLASARCRRRRVRLRRTSPANCAARPC